MQQNSAKTMEPNYGVLRELVHYFEVRLSALGEYSTRAWNRFNWFLTLELAVLGFFLSQVSNFTSDSFIRTGIPIVGAFVALLWAFLGAEDFVSMKKYGKRMTVVEEKVKDAFVSNGFDFEVSVRKSLFGISQTILLFLFPVFVALIWVFIACRY